MLTSTCRSTRRPTRGRTTTPAGRSSCMRNVVDQDGRPTSACSTQPMTLLDRRREGAGRHRRHAAPIADRRSHHRQHAGDVPLQARGREDAGGRGGRSRRAAASSAPARSSSRRRSREARADDQGARPLGVRGRGRADGARRTTSTCRASATSTRGRARRTKAGCARRSTPSACPTPTSPIIKLREGNLRAKYDVIVFPHVGGTPQSQVNGIADDRRAPLPYKKTAETPNLGVQDQADDIRGGMGSKGLMELVKFVQEGGTLITEGSTSTIFPEYNITERRHGRGAGEPVRARLDHARRVRRQEEPDRLRLRRRQAAGLLQPGRRC